MKNVSTPGDHNGHRARCLTQHDEQKKKLEAIRPSLSAKYSGKFVAFSDGEVIDADENELTLVKRIGKTHKDRFVIISRITSPEEELVCIDTLGM